MRLGIKMAMTAETYGQLIRDGRFAEARDAVLAAVIAAAGGDLSLRQELGGLRLVLERVMMVDALDADAHGAALTVASLVESITSVVRTERLLSGGTADSLAASVDKILADLGLGE